MIVSETLGSVKPVPVITVEDEIRAYAAESGFDQQRAEQHVFGQHFWDGKIAAFLGTNPGQVRQWRLADDAQYSDALLACCAADDKRLHAERAARAHRSSLRRFRKTAQAVVLVPVGRAKGRCKWLWADSLRTVNLTEAGMAALAECRTQEGSEVAA